MIFRQLYCAEDSSLTYLIGDAVTGEAVVIDPQPGQATLILAMLAEHVQRLKYVLRTHLHADQDPACGGLCVHTGALLVVGRRHPAAMAAVRVGDGDVVQFGDETITVIETPGHTPACVSYLWRDRVFCGDVLELGGCGQAVDETDAGQMYDSVRKRIYCLPDETLVFPGHDHAGRTVSTVGEERRRDTPLAALSRDGFIERLTLAGKRSSTCSAGSATDSGASPFLEVKVTVPRKENPCP